MIEFKPVRLEDKQIIERHTMPSGILNCDLAFANMYCWQAMYHSAWAVIDGFLVIRFHIGGGEKIGYMQPVGEGDFAGIIPALRADAHAHGQRLRIIGLTFPLAGFCIVSGSVFQALGTPFYSLIVSVCRQICVLLPVAYLLSLTGRLELVWWSFPIVEVMSFTLSTIFLRRTVKSANEVMNSSAD